MPGLPLAARASDFRLKADAQTDEIIRLTNLHSAIQKLLREREERVIIFVVDPSDRDRYTWALQKLDFTAAH